MTPRETTLAFVDAINMHSIGLLSALIHDDHILVDSVGSTVQGREAIRNAWIGYFYLVPDYHIHCDRIFEQGNTVAIMGSAEGTCRIGTSVDPVNHWSMPAAWLATVEAGKLTQWQVFADNEPVRKILEAP